MLRGACRRRIGVEKKFLIQPPAFGVAERMSGDGKTAWVRDLATKIIPCS